MGINFKDIVTLAAAGYKVSEVKELIALANSADTQAPNEDEQKGQPEKTEQHEAGKEQPEEAPEKGTDTSDKDSVILSYEKKVKELEDQVKDLQEQNVHKDQSDKKEKDDQQLLNELAASYM